ncbi:LOW QUALITY PROTEIN: NACHT domain- and WD repeat-containing protein 1 [Spinachia spinachia]
MAEHPGARAEGGGGGGGGGDASLQDVLRGQINGAQRTENGSNMIRVFVSSTFTDMSSERKALLEKAYPEVLAFCRSVGMVFEVVDLCWGIRSDSFGDHEACEIFLQEIKNSQRISAGPAFTALLGNRYGHRTLPRVIPEKQFEVLLSKLSKNPEGISQLNKWFLKDNNAVPPTYVLQPITTYFPYYSDLRPENVPQREKNLLSWRLTETQLLQLLRCAAKDAETAGDISEEQKQHYFTSVTAQEFEQGLWKDNSEQSALLFVREIPSQMGRDGPRRFAKYLDLTADGLLDKEVRGLLATLKSRLYATRQKILILHCVELNKGSIDPKRKEHAQYLDSVCEQFVSQMKLRIEAVVNSPVVGGPRRLWGNIEEEKKDISDRVVEEVLRHATMSTKLCTGLHGREGLLDKLCCAMWESTNVHHSPLVVHGDAGMGKTALLCKLAQEMRSVFEPGAAVVIRLLSDRHPQRPDIDHVLRSVCFQICLACGLAPPSPPIANTHPELLRFFWNALTKVSERGETLLIILDAVDQLSDQHHAHKLHWMPADLPPNVHLMVSVETNSEAFANMRLKLKSLGSFFEVDRLSRDEGKQMMESYLLASQRTLTPEQSDSVLQSFEQTGSPLHLTLILSAAKRWTSFTLLTATHLGPNTQEMMSRLLLTLEEKHGKELVGGALGYITLSRGGLLEAELRDIMSLDDDIICEVYRYSLPPSPSLIRLPPLLWARLKRDLKDQLEERWTSGVITIAFSNRHLCEAVSARYLTSQRRGQRLKILAEYFLGRWSGKLKPVSLPGLSLLLSDRKVPPQPLWFAPGLANIRKLEELPHHLLHAGLWEELRQVVIGSAEWLYCKMRVCGMSSVIQDLDLCSQYMDCTETRLIRDTLVLIKPSVDFLDGHMESFLFYSEVLARLFALARPFSSIIGQLCGQCEKSLLICPEPVLIPKCSFLQQPGGALQHTLTGLLGGVLCVHISVEAGLLVAGSDDGTVAVWSLADQRLVHSLLGHTGAVLFVKVIGIAAHCFSLAADGSLRRWSLMDGKQQLCIQEAVPVDSPPSSVFLHLSEQLICVYTRTQVKMWKLAGVELLLLRSSVEGDDDDDGSMVLGVLGTAVVRLCDSGLVRISHPVNESQTVETQVDSSPKRRLTPVKSVTLPKHGKVFVVSKEGFLHQISTTEKQTAVPFPLVPSLLSVTEDEKILLAGCERTLSLFNINRDSLDRFLDLQHDDNVLSSCVSSDCRLLVSGAADQLLQGIPLSLLHAPLSSMALLSDRKLLYGTSCGEVRFHDFCSGSSSDLEAHRCRVTCVTVSNRGTRALVGSEDAVLRLWNLSPLALDHTMEYKGFFFEGVLSAAFSESDQFVFTGSQDRTVKVWDVATGDLLYVQYVYSPVVRMVTARNGFVALSQQGSLIREVFRCPEHVSPDYNPLRNVKARYRITSMEKTSRVVPHIPGSDLEHYNPALFNLNLVGRLREKPSSACLIL